MKLNDIYQFPQLFKILACLKYVHFTASCIQIEELLERRQTFRASVGNFPYRQVQSWFTQHDFKMVAWFSNLETKKCGNKNIMDIEILFPQCIECSHIAMTRHTNKFNDAFSFPPKSELRTGFDITPVNIVGEDSNMATPR